MILSFSYGLSVSVCFVGLAPDYKIVTQTALLLNSNPHWLPESVFFK